MKPERWQQLDELFHSALERNPKERADFLDEACADHDSLRNQVEALIAADEKARSFIESPAIEVEARGVASDQEKADTAMTSGETISHYRIISPLGSGGMGEVYLAQDTRLSRQVALKLLPEYFTRDRDRLRRFQQEARAASALNHPNIITIFEIGQVDDRHFIVTEFIDGTTLRQNFFGDERQASGKQLRLRQVLDVAIQTADALAAVHEAGIVHRDIKPQNIMVRRRDGYVKVLDFGLAKLTAGAVDTEGPTRALVKTSAGVVMGTASYMSPEQARGEKVDVRTDLWSLGVVVYEMMAGCTPFERSTASEVIALILEREPPPLARYRREVPAELERIISKALIKNREERYQTAKDLLVDLRRLRQRLDVEAEIERTAEPEKSSDEKAVATGNEQTVTAPAATAETGVAAVQTDPTLSAVKKLRLNQRGPFMALAALVVVTATGAYFAYLRYWVETRASIDANAGIRSLAVLPFTNESNKQEMEYLSDGVSESLINSLSQLPGLKVIARTSSFKYKGKEIDPQEVANTLGVQAIVTGRIVRLGDNLQISVELVDARNKTQIWGEQYNRKAEDLQAVQGEVARTILEKLSVKLSGAQERQVTKRPTENPEAYRLYLNGEFYGRKGRTEDERKALDYYNRAIALDPNFALAYVRLAHEYDYFGNTGTLDPKETQAKAKAAVEKALELDDTLAQAHATLGGIKINEWDWAGANSEYERALELNPNLASAHGAYSVYLLLMGRHTEALAEIKRSQQLDPLNIFARYREGATLVNARQYDEAIGQLQHVIEMQPDYSFAHFFLGMSYAMKGMYPEAIAAYQRFSSIEGETTSEQIYLGYVYAMSGQREKALAILNKLKTTKEYVSPAELAILYTGLGDKEGAFQSLERAYGAHDLQMQYLKVEPHYDSLRSDPRFTDLMRRVGLPL